MKPRLLRSPLTGEVFVITRYTIREGGILVAQTKYNVTDDFNAILHSTKRKPSKRKAVPR